MSRMNFSPMSELARKVEALMFVSSSPVSERDLREALHVNGRALRTALEELAGILEGHGVYLRNLAGGWVIETCPDMADVVGEFLGSSSAKRVRLSKAAIETAAVIAQKQPVTRGEIDEIRGVNSASPLAKLLELGLVRTAGRRKEGRPSLLYVTTVKFLEVFGINDVGDIPAPEEIDTEEELAT